MSKHWFVPKSYGWGFVPVSWQGWLMTLVLIGLGVLSAYANGFFDPATFEAGEEVIWMAISRLVLDLVFLIVAFSYFAERKTEGALKWNWGGK